MDIKDIRTRLSADFLIYWFTCAAFLSIPFGTSPPVICGGLAALVWIVSGKPVILRHTFIGRRWFWPVLVLILLPWVGLLYTPDPTGFGIDYAEKTHYWLYAFVVASIPFTKFLSERLIKAFLLGMAINALIAILQLIGIFPEMNPHAYGLGLGYGATASFLVLGILMTSFYFRNTQDNRKRVLLGVLMGGYFFHLIILKGRAGFFTFLVLSPLILHNLSRKLSIFRTSLAYLAIVGIMLLSPIVRDQIARSVDQVKYHLNIDSDEAWGKGFNLTENRLFAWRGGVEIFLEHPIIGVGTGGYPVVYHEKGNPDWPFMEHPHNNFLYMAVSFGVIGILALIWYLWEIFKNAWEARDTPLGYFVFSATLAIFVIGLVNTAIVDASTAFLLALVTGLQNGFPKFAKILSTG